MTADNRTSQADTYSGNRPEGGPDLSAMTFFSERRSLFFIALLYFSDSLLILSVIVSGLIAAPAVLLCGRLIYSRGVSLPFPAG